MRLIIQDILIILLVIVCTITVLLDFTEKPDASSVVFRVSSDNKIANSDDFELDSEVSYNVKTGPLMDVDEEVDEMIVGGDEIVYEPINRITTKLLQCEGPGGLGNKIRSISSCYMLAEILDRQLVVIDNWPTRCPMSNHFEPSHLHLQRDRFCNKYNSYVLKVPFNYHKIINSQSIMELRKRNESCILIKSSTSFMYQNFDEPVVQLLKEKNLTSKSLRSTFRNVFKKLFKPKINLQQIVDNNLNQMRDVDAEDDPKKLICFEVKSGWDEAGVGKWTENCYQNLIQTINENIRNFTDSKVFLSTDSNLMGSLIKLTFGDNIHVAEEKLMEFSTDKLTGTPCTLYNKIYTDFLILTLCDKSYTSHFSSFGLLSARLNQLLTMNVMKCEENRFSIIEKDF